MGLEGGFLWVRIMEDEISEHIPLTLVGLFCWEDACQQLTVNYIMGSRG
jgi:hypothetical protein